MTLERSSSHVVSFAFVLALILIVSPRFVAQAPSEAHFALSASWSTGFTCDVTITNRSTITIDPWSLVFNWPPQITSLWNGVLVGQMSGSTTVAPASWNSSLAPNASVTFGFTADGVFSQNVTGCTLNGVPVVVTYSMGNSNGGNPNPGATIITLTGIADDSVSRSISGATPSTFQIGVQPPAATTTFAVDVSNPDVLGASLTGSQLVLTPIASGFAGVRIRELASGASRSLGIAVRTPAERMPGMPRRLAIGSVSEDTANQLAFWRSLASGDQNRRMDIRYIYINGGPVNGWRTWTPTPGARVTNYIRESKRLGMIPYFVYYNVPDGGESYDTDSLHLFSPTYMAAYYQDLAFFLDLVASETRDGWPVGIIFEPDLLGYMAQNGLTPTQGSWTAPSGATGSAQTSAAYQSLDLGGAPILDAAIDPVFPNTLRGFVESVNRLVEKRAPEAIFGWQMNLWASPPGGFTGVGIPGNGIIRKTDTSGITLGRQQIQSEAAAITAWYVSAGIATHGASFVSIDKYGLDAGAEGTGAVTNPASSTWFWNADHWGNYLLFAEAMFQTAKLPVVLWQIPVGHVDTSSAPSPTSANGLFAPLANTYQRYEDSAATYFLGDTFTATGVRAAWFASNAGIDPLVSQNGSQITWGPHLAAATSKGVIAILFGAGVGASTHGIPPGTSSASTPTDDGWWITQSQRAFLAGPVPLIAATDLRLLGVSPVQIAPLVAGSPSILLSLTGQGFDASSVVYAEQTPLATTLVSPTTLTALLPSTILSAQLRGGLSLAVRNGGRQTSASLVLRVGSSGNQGVIHTSPIVPQPFASLSVTIEGVPSGRLYSLFADLNLAPPATGFPSPTINWTVAVAPGSLIPVTDGLGLFGPPSFSAFAIDPQASGLNGAAGRASVQLPFPPIGLVAALQAIYVDPSSPIAFGLTHAFRLRL